MRLRLFSLFYFFTFLFFNFPLFSITYDFHFGSGIGLQNNQFTNIEPSTINYNENVIEFTYNTDLISDFIWSGSAFIGGGICFNNFFITSSIGLEYSASYISDTIKVNLTDVSFSAPKSALPFLAKSASSSYHTGKASRYTQILQNFLDFYLKIALSEKLLIDIQFNLGLSVKKILNQDEKSELNKGPISVQSYLITKYTHITPVFSTINKNSFKDFVGLGLHTGIRLNFSMLYLSLDYSYTPTFYLCGREYSSPSYGKLNSHGIGITTGITFSKTLLNSLF